MQGSGHGQHASDRRREAERPHRDMDRRRTSQQPLPIAPPSPALVRHGSKQRKVPAALTPGGGHSTPQSAVAQANVPVGPSTPHQLHPYAAGAQRADYYGHQDDFSAQAFGRSSPMVSSVGAAPAAVTDAQATRGQVGAGQGDHAVLDAEVPKPSLWKLLTCRGC